MTLTTFTTLSFYILISSSFTSGSTPISHTFKRIYAFGDSFTDTGNTKSATGPTGFSHVSSPPYGMTFFHHPTSRYSDGRLVIDFVAEKLNIPYLPPYLKSRNGRSAFHGVNFAVGGSTAINHAFFVNNNLSLDATPQSIQTQFIWFEKLLKGRGCEELVYSLSPECRKVFDDALFWVGEIGVNDYAYTLTSTNVPLDTIRPLAIETLTLFLQAILKKGVKQVVVQGLPPVGCLPLSLYLYSGLELDETGCIKHINNLSIIHNTAYLSKIQKLRRQFPNATITYVDFYNAYHTVMKSPQKYGIKEPLMACCGSGGPPYNFDVFATCGTQSAGACKNPSQYISWDGIHLTEGMYKVLYDLFVKGGFSHPPLGNLLTKKEVIG